MSEDKADLFLYYWKMLGDKTFPEPEREYRFDKELGRKHRFDFAFIEQKVAVEVDGGQYTLRGGRHSTDTDREKLNIAASLGWLVFRFSPGQLQKYPASCIEIVAQALKLL